MSTPLPLIPLGRSDLRVTPICLGTMTFGQQVGEAAAHDLLDQSLARGVNFIDTAEMYAVPAREATFGATESIIGRWVASRPGTRGKVVLAGVTHRMTDPAGVLIERYVRQPHRRPRWLD